MAVALTVREFLEDRHIAFEEFPHAKTDTSMSLAQSVHLPGDFVAKAVVLKDRTGAYVMAILPATHHIEMDAAIELFGDKLEMAEEDELGAVFEDCAVGAIPPAGRAYGLPMIWDDRVTRGQDVYFEGGDHTTIVHVERDGFVRMMGEAQHGLISHHM